MVLQEDIKILNILAMNTGSFNSIKPILPDVMPQINPSTIAMVILLTHYYQLTISPTKIEKCELNDIIG